MINLIKKINYRNIKWILLITISVGFLNNLHAQNSSDIQNIQILKDSQSFDKKLEIVSKAKKSIWMSVMVFDCSESSKFLFDKMIEKQEKENVDVRIIAEGLYMKTLSSPCYKYLKNNNIKVTQVFDHLKKGGNIKRMMHQKFFIVDEEEVILGGQNFLKYQNEANEENQFVRDNDVYIKSRRISHEAADEFVWQWNFFSDYDKINNFEFVNDNTLNNCKIYIQNPRRNKDEIDQYLSDNLISSTQSLKMYTPGMIYEKNNIFNMLKEKVINGYDFRLILPGQSKNNNEATMFFKFHKEDQWPTNQASAVLNFLGQTITHALSKKSIKGGLENVILNQQGKGIIYGYPRYSHSKIYIFDNKTAFIGSLNLDDQSLDNNYEIGFGCDDPDYINQLTQMFDEDVLKATQVHPVKLKDKIK